GGRKHSPGCRSITSRFCQLTHEEMTMFLARILDFRSGSSRRRSRKLKKSPPAQRLLLEQLEDRITPATQTFTATFGPQATNFTLMQAIMQFNPSQGQLTEVDISFNGSFTSTIQAENQSTESPDTITATASGTLTLSGPGVSPTLNPSITFPPATVQVFDGMQDFMGPDTATFGPTTASAGPQTTVLHASDSGFSQYIGTGTVSFTSTANGSSLVTDTNGNVVSLTNSSAPTMVPVPYVFVTPPVAGSLSGFVYLDGNNNGIRDANEFGIQGVTVTLSGVNDLNQPVTSITVTGPDGSYLFGNLRPGTYQITETQPTGFLEGQADVGTLGGVVINSDQIGAIPLSSGANGTEYDFGERIAISK